MSYSLILIGSITKKAEIEMVKSERVIPKPFGADKVNISIADEVYKRS